jgi:protease II
VHTWYPPGRPCRLQCVQERAFGTLYSVSHTGQWLVITTNADGAKNFKLLVAPIATPRKAFWKPLPKASADVVSFDYEPARMVRLCSRPMTCQGSVFDMRHAERHTCSLENA